jgi:hypothetical protein
VARERHVNLEDLAGFAYAGLISDQLREERDTKASLEQRALAVIGASGALVTLTFGFLTLVQPANSGPQNLLIDKRLLGIGLVLFVFAAVFALMVSWPGLYAEADAESLANLTKDDFWKHADPILGARRVAELQVDLIRVARERNKRKADWLARSIVLVIAAVAILGASTYPVFLGRVL